MRTLHSVTAVLATLCTKTVLGRPGNHSLLARDQGWVIQVFGQLDCTDSGVILEGANPSLDPADISYVDWGIEWVGGIKILQVSTNGDSVYLDDERFIYLGLCGCSDSQITEFVHCGDQDTTACYTVGDTIGQIGIGETACDAVGLDSIYRKDKA
ncbi:hypothetical protein CLCR_05226 [Cladophialophora carrionii]|uniref:Uncharacterized protein n=1 Tax=Cladophialophora carrionii TaxID=86049 RepID=A0A1C1CKW0_9EURO|nr:hypothetical protein CLCR_05226 [Cladophialophora carrionii]